VGRVTGTSSLSFPCSVPAQSRLSGIRMCLEYLLLLTSAFLDGVLPPASLPRAASFAYSGATVLGVPPSATQSQPASPTAAQSTGRPSPTASPSPPAPTGLTPAAAAATSASPATPRAESPVPTLLRSGTAAAPRAASPQPAPAPGSTAAALAAAVSVNASPYTTSLTTAALSLTNAVRRVRARGVGPAAAAAAANALQPRVIMRPIPMSARLRRQIWTVICQV